MSRERNKNLWYNSKSGRWQSNQRKDEKYILVVSYTKSTWNTKKGL